MTELPEDWGPWKKDVRGVLFIGDPHLASRTPGFRQDDYPRVTLEKLRWCLQLAAKEELLPVLLGDLFHWPRENANWLMVELMEILSHQTIVGIPGNHDCRENELSHHDSLMLLVEAGRIVLLDRDGPWCGFVEGWPVMVGGTAWGQPLPDRVVCETQPHETKRPVTVWITHHNVVFKGPEIAQYIHPHPIRGLDLLVNGHIHCQEPDTVCGRTTWLNPGNISRVSRDDAIRAHEPAVLRMNIDPNTGVWSTVRIPVPHRPFEEVFYDEVLEASAGVEDRESAFVRGLSELAARRTESGEGLVYFLEKNLPNFEPQIAQAIRGLALEVLPDEHPWRREERTAGHSDAQTSLRGTEQEKDPS